MEIVSLSESAIFLPKPCLDAVHVQTHGHRQGLNLAVKPLGSKLFGQEDLCVELKVIGVDHDAYDDWRASGRMQFYTGTL